MLRFISYGSQKQQQQHERLSRLINSKNFHPSIRCKTMKALLLLLLLLFILVVAAVGNPKNETNVNTLYSHGSDGYLEDGDDIEEQQELLDLDAGLEPARELQRGCFRDGDRCIYDSHCCGGECVWTRTTRYIRGASYGICLGGGANSYNNYNYGPYNNARCSRDSHCPRGYYCNWRRALCERVGGVNTKSYCTSNSHCPRGFYCDWRRNICQMVGGGVNTYGNCLRTSDCRPGMHCRSNFCTW